MHLPNAIMMKFQKMKKLARVLKGFRLGCNLWVHAKLLQSCLTLCDPTDCRPPGFSVHGILQAIMLEWVAMPFAIGCNDLVSNETKLNKPSSIFYCSFISVVSIYKISYFI